MAKSSKSDPEQYTKPELRDRIKKKVTASDKGGNAGQWSARKAQLVTQEYEKEGGDYKKERGTAQKSLEKWGDEKWQTSEGSANARHKGGTKRYLPKKAWSELSDSEKAATNERKERGTRAGKQFVSNTKAAQSARKSATKKTVAKKATAKKGATKKRATAKRS